MFLDRLVLTQAGPFDHLDLDMRGQASPNGFGEDPRWVHEDGRSWVGSMRGRVSVLHGAGGTGKSLLLGAICSTRPGHTQRLGQGAASSSASPGGASVQCHWSLGQEEPNRPHPLVVTNAPSAQMASLDAGLRREQAIYDRKASCGGFAAILIPAHRRFGQSPIYLADPARTMQGYEPRAGSAWLDPARADLTRPIKQILAYASIGAIMQAHRRQVGTAGASMVGDPELTASGAVQLLDQALRAALRELLKEQAIEYVGADPGTFEPMFRSAHGAFHRFDQLPQQARHLMAPVVLAMHHFWTSAKGADPRSVQGVIAIDDAELHLTEATQEFVLPRYRELLPQAQWIVATTSWRIAASVKSSEVIALRQQMQTGTIDPYQGHLSLTH